MFGYFFFSYPLSLFFFGLLGVFVCIHFRPSLGRSGRLKKIEKMEVKCQSLLDLVCKKFMGPIHWFT